MQAAEPVRTYSYDPARALEGGLDRMRLELGDTTLAPGELTAALCDQEYQAILCQYPGWQEARLHCLRAIVMKFSHQVDMQVNGGNGLSYDFSSRVAIWRDMLEKEERKSRRALPIPPGCGGQPYFFGDMHANPRKG